MNRRIFLYRASMGALGFSCFLKFPLYANQPGVATSLESFFLSIGAQAVENNSTLAEICTKESIPWIKTGYQPFNNKYYLCQKGQKAIFLLHLPHEENGSLDISALVLQEDISLESWRLAASLSGFQLEALIKASTALKTCPDASLRNWVKSVSMLFWGKTTLSGLKRLFTSPVKCCGLQNTPRSTCNRFSRSRPTLCLFVILYKFN